MAYRLKRKETVVDGIRRIAHQQLARGAAELVDESLEPAAQIHQVRKRLKKLSALLRLVRVVGAEVTVACPRTTGARLSRKSAHATEA